MMRALAVGVAAAALCVGLLALAGCEPATPQEAAAQRAFRPTNSLFTEHDDVRKVTCWIRNGTGGVSCLPDWMLVPQSMPIGYQLSGGRP